MRARDVISSKGIALGADWRGPPSYWRAWTERIQPDGMFARHYRGAHGLVWVRLGTGARNGRRNDLDRFAAEALPTITRPFVLLTTDGDCSVPGDLDPGTVARLLASLMLRGWFTQNHDGGGGPLLRPFPIGLDLHTRPRFTTASGKLRLLSRIAEAAPPLNERPLGVFTDLGVNVNSVDRRLALDALDGWAAFHRLAGRVDQAEVWRRYSSFPFVLSAHGNGLDCHRTWEVLLLGAIPIVRRSTLDPLYRDLPVAIVDDWAEVRLPGRLDAWRAELGPLTDRTHVWPRLAAAHWLERARTALTEID